MAAAAAAAHAARAVAFSVKSNGARSWAPAVARPFSSTFNRLARPCPAPAPPPVPHADKKKREKRIGNPRRRPHVHGPSEHGHDRAARNYAPGKL